MKYCKLFFLVSSILIFAINDGASQISTTVSSQDYRPGSYPPFVSELLKELRRGSSLSSLTDFSKDYFRSDPYTQSFSTFLKHLTTDPDIHSKKLLKKTDSSFFSFSGTYTRYNPFSFKPSRIEVYLDETNLPYADSLPYQDTVFIYQIVAYTTGDKKGVAEVQKQFDKIHKKYYRKFYRESSQAIVKNESVSGGIHHYFTPYSGVAPVTLYWTLLPETNETALMLVLRMKHVENQATLPVPLYDPK